MLCLLAVVILGPLVAVALLALRASSVERLNDERRRRQAANGAPCPQCGGTGTFSPRLSVDPVDPMVAAYVGAGRLRSTTCPRCQGTGFLPLEGTEPAAPAPARLNRLAVVALVLAITGLFTIVTGVVAAFVGDAARRQCWERGEAGLGLAEASRTGGIVAAAFGLLIVPIGLAALGHPL